MRRGELGGTQGLFVVVCLAVTILVTLKLLGDSSYFLYYNILEGYGRNDSVLFSSLTVPSHALPILLLFSP